MSALTPERWLRIRELFEQAIDLPIEQRSEFLRRACPQDPAMLAEVDSLLSAAKDVDAFLEQPAMVSGAAVLADRFGTAADPLIGSRIASYTVTRRIAAGGMGVVYEAMQQNPARRVALKVIRTGLDSAEARHRFVRESQWLGRLQHPGIAHIIEAGEAVVRTDKGESGERIPFLAMEFVEGRPLNDYAKQRKLTRIDRLRLMATIAEAVHHAHQKGVIHRDLKPANILVIPPAEAGSETITRGSSTIGIPKILDFGVARAVEPATAATMRTDAGRIIGTIAYMSPEQLAGDRDEIDIRADVYALGAICYELLAGRPAHDVSGKPIVDAIRSVNDVEPTRLGSIDRSARGDLETIISRAMNKDRVMRYQSAIEFAADIDRFLANEPIAARPATTLYQIRKFARRHRLLVVAAIIVFLVLILGVTGTTIGLVRANREAFVAQKMNAYLTGILAWFDPDVSGSPTFSLEQVLDEAIKRVDRELQDEPEVSAALLNTIGDAYRAAGRFDKSDVALQQALALRIGLHGEQHADVAETLNHLAVLRRRQENSVESESLHRRALAIREAVLGPKHPDTIESLHNLAGDLLTLHRAAEAEPILLEALRRHRDIGGNEINLAQGLSTLGSIYAGQGRFEEAIKFYRESAAIYRANPGLHEASAAICLSNLGEISNGFMGDHVGAEEALRESLRIRRRILPPNHPDLADAVDDYSRALFLVGRYEEAIALSHEYLDPIFASGVLNPGVATGIFIRAIERQQKCLLRLNRPLDAIEALEKAVGFLESQTTSTDPRIAKLRALLDDQKRGPQSAPNPAELPEPPSNLPNVD